MERRSPSPVEPAAAGSALEAAPGLTVPAPHPPSAAERIPGLECRLVEESQSRRAIEVTVPAGIFEGAVQAELRRIRQRVRIRGFRKGKAPKEQIERLHGAEANDLAIRKLLARATKQSLHEVEVRPLDVPQARVTGAARGGALTARLTFSVWPVIGKVDYSGLQVTARERAVTEADIGETLEHLRMERARPGPIEGRGLQDDDFVVGDLEETESPGTKPLVTKDLALRVGTGAYHPALHEALQGASQGDTVIATAHFGEQSPDPDRAGRTIRAQFTITEASAPVLPALDDDFARAFGASSLLALRGDIRDRLRRQAALDDRRRLASQLATALIEKNPLEAPRPLVERDLERRVRLLGRSLLDGGARPEQARADLEKNIPALRAESERAVASALLLDALADQENIESPEAAVEARVEALAKTEGKAPAAVRAALEGDGRLRQMETEARREETIDFLERRAEVKAP